MLSREADIENRQLRLELLSEPGKTKTNTPSPDDRKLIASQIFEDFERIQIINRDMLQASSTLNALTYKRISTLADEMNKRARRLKSNLAITDVEKKENEETLAIDPPQLKASLQALDVSLKGFVMNPIFKDPRVTTVGQLVNLRRDISNVIEISRTVKKVAGKLNN